MSATSSKPSIPQFKNVLFDEYPMFWLHPTTKSDGAVNGEYELVMSSKVKTFKDLRGIGPEELTRRLYIIAKIAQTIDDFGEAGENTFRYAFFELGSTDDLSDDFAQVWGRRAATITEFADLIASNAKQLRTREDRDRLYDNIEPAFKFDNFVLTKTNHETTVTVKNSTAMTIFDSIQTDDVVIGCFFKEIIKFNPKYKNLIDSYLSGNEVVGFKKKKLGETIKVMVAEGRQSFRLITVLVHDGSDISQPTSTPDFLSYVTFSVETPIGSADNIDHVAIIKRLLSSIQDEAHPYENRVTNEYYYGSYSAFVRVPLVVVKEVLTNKSVFFAHAYLNESALINTRKTNLNVFIKMRRDVGNEIVTVGLFEKPETVGTLVKIKKIRGGADLTDRINECVKHINKLIQQAFEDTQRVEAYYKRYMDISLKSELVMDSGSEIPLKKLLPEIFQANYTRLCAHPPIVVEDVVGSDPDRMLTFPIHGEAEPVVYKCVDKKYKYPGLHKNTRLNNRDRFPFLPCCYQQPQTLKANYLQYYNNTILSKRINLGEIGKTLKVLSPNRIGELSPKVAKLLEMTTKTKFYRMGISPGPASCIEALINATDRHQVDTDGRNPSLLADESSLALSIQRTRKHLSKFAVLCKPEMSEYSVQHITRELLNQSTYINPRLFKGALEAHFDVSIILFSRDEDDFSTYPDKLYKFNCPLKRKVVLLFEHEQPEHVELIIDHETSLLINRQTKVPRFDFESQEPKMRKIWKLYRSRFAYMLYNIASSSFENVLDTTGSQRTQVRYPWEFQSGNGRVQKGVLVLSQYVDSVGKTRLVEFADTSKVFASGGSLIETRFVGVFNPLPCVDVPIKALSHFVEVNSRLSEAELKELSRKFSWLSVYSLSLGPDDRFLQFKRTKKLAEYIFWAAVTKYTNLWKTTNITVAEWIDKHTTVLDGYSYSGVKAGPVFDFSGLLTSSAQSSHSQNNLFIFNSEELRKRVKFNLQLISPLSLKHYQTFMYLSYYNEMDNFKIVEPTQIAFSKKEYYQKTRASGILNVLSTNNLRYVQMGSTYFIQDLFGYAEAKNVLCVFLPSFDQVFKYLAKYDNFDSTVNIVNVVVFSAQSAPQKYTLGKIEPHIDLFLILINNVWFYGLCLPNIV